MLIDSHSHIDGAEFQLDIDEVFARMKEAEVGGALVAGTSLQDYERGLNFANAHKNVWYAAGVHPSTKDDDHEASIGELVGLTKPQKVVAIGECGLDYYYEEAPYDAQLERFARHIEAAKLANLPVIVHSRDAQEKSTTQVRQALCSTASQAIRKWLKMRSISAAIFLFRVSSRSRTQLRFRKSRPGFRAIAIS